MMNGLNFSARGTRWRVMIVTNHEAAKEYVPPLPGSGLLFTAADGDTRFMPLEPAAVPTIDELRGKSNEELGSLVQLAASWK